MQPTSSPSLSINAFESLVSKICHDLIGPAGAIGNGLELIEEMGADAHEDALSLIGDSAARAASRLNVFRLAFGRAGRGFDVDIGAVKQAFAELIAQENRLEVDWPEGEKLDEALQTRPEAAKLVLNVLLIAKDCLPRGGVIAFRRIPSGAEIRAEGERAGCPEEIRFQLDGTAPADTQEEPPSPKAAGALLTRLLIMEQNAGTEILEAENTLAFRLTFS